MITKKIYKQLACIAAVNYFLVGVGSTHLGWEGASVAALGEDIDSIDGVVCLGVGIECRQSNPEGL